MVSVLHGATTGKFSSQYMCNFSYSSYNGPLFIFQLVILRICTRSRNSTNEIIYIMTCNGGYMRRASIRSSLIDGDGFYKSREISRPITTIGSSRRIQLHGVICLVTR